MTPPPRPAPSDFPNLPEALAIIMDGNGRWAEERDLPRFRGHEVGAESVRAITRECARLGIKELTLYAFSTENWRRPDDEVLLPMRLLERYLVDEPLLMEWTQTLGGRLLDPIKTTVVQDQRSMTTWVLRKL
jgi:undecaprenyl pyrophosphate synthase